MHPPDEASSHRSPSRARRGTRPKGGKDGSSGVLGGTRTKIAGARATIDNEHLTLCDRACNRNRN